jgi:hypothetical protein
VTTVSRTTTFVVALCLGAFIGPALAANVTVIARGTVTEFDDPEGRFPFGEVTPGVTTFILTMPLDLSVTDSTPGDATRGDYRGAVTSMSLEVNGITKTIFDPAAVYTTTVENDYPNGFGGYYDGWRTNLQEGSPPGEVVTMSLNAKSSPVPIANTSLPLQSDSLIAPFMSDDWNESIFLDSSDYVGGSCGDCGGIFLRALLRGDVQSIQVVPVPAAVWLFGSALGLLGWLRRGNM